MFGAHEGFGPVGCINFACLLVSAVAILVESVDVVTVLSFEVLVFVDELQEQLIIPAVKKRQIIFLNNKAFDINIFLEVTINRKLRINKKRSNLLG
jgi:hypothetical protein